MTVDEWMDTFAECVRERNYAAARSLIARKVFSFGTVAVVATGRAELERYQWERVWPNTHGFAWTERMVLELNGHDTLVAARWRSFRGDVERQGRASILLRAERGGLGLLEAVHTHFSINPSTKDL